MRTILLVTVAAGICLAQSPDVSTLSGHANFLQNLVKGNIIKAAEKMPADAYTVRPTPDIRSYAELIAHVADANYLFCSATLGEKSTVPSLEEAVKKDAKTSKATIVEGLKASFTYCDKAFAALTDANAGEPMKFFGVSRPRLGILSFETSHLFEHYGNIVTYLRLQKIVPPSSEPRK